MSLGVSGRKVAELEFLIVIRRKPRQGKAKYFRKVKNMFPESRKRFIERNGVPILLGIIVAILAVFVHLRAWQPNFERPLPADQQFINVGGFSYRIANSKNPYFDPAPIPFKKLIIENGRPLSEASFSEVAEVGNGLYAYHATYGIRFAPTGNVDPNKSGHAFAVRTYLFVPLQYRAVALALAALFWLPWALRKISVNTAPWDEFNLLAIVFNWWSGVDRRYKVALAVAFPVTLLTFSIFTFHYLLFDHQPYLPDIPHDEQRFAGRWFWEFVLWLTAFSNIPVFQQVLAMAFQLGAGLVALRLWGLRSLTSFAAVIVLLIVCIHPNNIAFYFHTHWAPKYPFSALLAALGMLLASREGGGWWGNTLRMVAGGVLVCLAVATYQSSMSVAATLAAGLAIMRLSEHSGSLRNLFLRHFQPVWSMLVAFGLGGILYWISLKIAGIKHIPAYLGGGDILHSTTDVLQRFVEVTWKSFYALLVTQPEFGRPLKLVLLAALLLAVGFLVSAVATRHPGRKALMAIKLAGLAGLLVGMVMATKTLFYTVSMPGHFFFAYRYNLAMIFFTAFCFYAIFATASGAKSGFGPWRSLAAVTACCVLFVFVRADLLRQGMLLHGHRHDLLMANRILERVESLPDLDLSKTYTIIRLGPYSSERLRMMNTFSPYEAMACKHMDQVEITSAGWVPEGVFNVLGSRVSFNNSIAIGGTWGNLKRAAALVEKRKAQKWPHPSSVFIEDDLIVVNM